MSRFSIEKVTDRRSSHEDLFADLRVVGLQRMAKDTRLSLATPRSYTRPLLIWVTRGQGRLTLGDQTRGYGTNNVIFLPAGAVHGIDVPATVLGQAVFLPDHRELLWPETPLLLRCRDGALMGEVTNLVDLIQRMAAVQDEESERSAFHAAGLVSVFLARHRDGALPAFSSARRGDGPA